jgi:cytoskeletal protein CcmA (bactofilin family)
MGRVVIIVLLIAAVTFTTISLVQNKNRSEVSDNTAQSAAIIQAKSLSVEALNYGLKRLSQGTINFVNNKSTLIFPDFNVLEGKIDSINFVQNTSGDSIIITTHVTIPTGNIDIHKSASAMVKLLPANIRAAVSGNGDVIVKGNAAVIGDIESNVSPPLDFENILGLPKSDMESIANNIYIDPSVNQGPCANITWIKFTKPGNSYKVSSTGWSGSGLLVIDGNAEFSGGTFYGLMWITGKLRIMGNLRVEGALFVEGGTEIEDTIISGSPVIEFNLDAVSDILSSVSFPSNMEYKIVSIFND